ncbi:MAG: GNAT family N-acetyltransferase [Anaerolineaceae bacterium]|nr:GNAT family N-acetyltransferase [Anaerolineaceae bacterium]
MNLYPYDLTPASLSDLSQLNSLEKACFPLDAWPLIEQIAVLTFPGIVRIKAVQYEMMVGFIGGDAKKLQKTGWITTLAVLPQFRRQGLAGALLHACEQALKMPTVRLSVRASNQDAIYLYTKHGYSQVDVWRHYYQGGEDAIVMSKFFPQFQS